jgi:hypothetical protein
MMSLFDEDRPKLVPQPKAGWQEELKGYLNIGICQFFRLLLKELIMYRMERNKSMPFLEGE